MLARAFILAALKRPVLLDLARAFGIFGVSALRKDDLVDLLSKRYAVTMREHP